MDHLKQQLANPLPLVVFMHIKVQYTGGLDLLERPRFYPDKELFGTCFDATKDNHPAYICPV